ncbi:hypothetical protein AOLI_G00094330 [Acnodon oligacanthus]
MSLTSLQLSLEVPCCVSQNLFTLRSRCLTLHRPMLQTLCDLPGFGGRGSIASDRVCDFFRTLRMRLSPSEWRTKTQ